MVVGNIQHLTLNILQKESFCTPKRILLHSKTSPFTNKEGVSKVEKIRIGLLVGGYSIPAIPTQSTENEGRVGRAGMPYPPTFVAFNPYN